eukprot:COSAG02_NODE_8694_length_2477_cov_2.194281_1_plen_147_part_00
MTHSRREKGLDRNSRHTILPTRNRRTPPSADWRHRPAPIGATGPAWRLPPGGRPSARWQCTVLRPMRAYEEKMEPSRLLSLDSSCMCQPSRPPFFVRKLESVPPSAGRGVTGPEPFLLTCPVTYQVLMHRISSLDRCPVSGLHPFL